MTHNEEVTRLAEEAKRVARHLFELSEVAEDMVHLSRAIDALRDAALRTEQRPAEPLTWEATTAGYAKFVSQRRYECFSPSVRAWYRPICQKCSAPAASSEDARDAARLDWLQQRGATVEILPGGPGLNWEFRVGGLYCSVGHSIRKAIDAAIAATPEAPK